MDKIVRDNLLAIATSYARATGKSMTQVSKDFYGNADFFVRLRAGKRSVSVRQLSKMLDKFRDAWPQKAEWPPVRAVTMGRYPQR